MQITDRLTITDKRRTADGYLVTTARFARTGIYEYGGAEVGKPDMKTVRVFRPDDEVFSEDAMSSFAYRPVTNDHPGESVTAESWKRDAVGFTDGRIARDGDYVVVPLMVSDAAAIADVEAGKSELSAGYSCDLEFIDGVTPKGETYDAIMRNIRGNHIAIVDSGRAGSECRIGDDNTGVATMKVMFDGIEIEATAQSAQAITKLQDQLSAKDKIVTDAQAAHDVALAAKDTELATKDTEIADLKTKVLDAATLDQRVADRAKLVADAKRIVTDFDGAGKTDAEIKRAVVQAKCGDAAVTDKSDAYVDARFDGLVEAQPAPDGVRDHVMAAPITSDGKAITATDAAKAADDALDASVANLNSWRDKATA